METRVETIERISLDTAGVKLGEKWFSVVGKAANYLPNVHPGDKIEVGEFQGKISFLRKVNGGPEGARPMLAGQGKDNSFTPPKYIERMATALERLAVAVERLAPENQKP